jgi:hypothetical protein
VASTIGVATADDDCAVGLLGELAGLERDLLAADSTVTETGTPAGCSLQ